MTTRSPPPGLATPKKPILPTLDELLEPLRPGNELPTRADARRIYQEQVEVAQKKLRTMTTPDKNIILPDDLTPELRAQLLNLKEEELLEQELVDDEEKEMVEAMTTVDVENKAYHPLMQFPSHVLLASNKSMPFDRFVRAVARREAPTLMNPDSELAQDILMLATDRAEKLRKFLLERVRTKTP